MEELILDQTNDFKQLLDGFENDCRLRDMHPETIRRYRTNLVIFHDFLITKGIQVTEINNNVLKDFLSYIRFERKNKHKTVGNSFTSLSTFYDYLQFEGKVNVNTVAPFRKRFLKRYKDGFDTSTRKCVSVEVMSKYVNSILDPRDKAISVLLAKTGIRRGELLKIDLEDVNWENYSVILKPHPKRGNRVVYFDDECALVLKHWINIREKMNQKTNALFISYQSGNRLDRNGCWTLVVKYAKRLGLHDPSSPRLEDHFGPHCFRHYYTTMLLRNGMKREYVKKLRGDGKSEAIDIYNHIDEEDLRRSYLAYVPKLGL
jgi:integrase/recombinase XerD